ncbi:MAG TPA: hypothetical protein PLV68_14545, partial [Ilumatobacteraceae bacterium]|nr:hypothetical protein [Ilumatobacteraceae bacterium]
MTRRGARCAIGYATNEANAAETAVRTAEVGAGAVLVKGDIATEGPAIAASAIAQLGGLDAIVVTAGVETLGR